MSNLKESKNEYRYTVWLEEKPDGPYKNFKDNSTGETTQWKYDHSDKALKEIKKVKEKIIKSKQIVRK